MSNYSYDEMTLCKDCHFKDDSPDICFAYRGGKLKPGTMTDWDDCARHFSESKWNRIPQEEKNRILKKYGF